MEDKSKNTNPQSSKGRGKSWNRNSGNKKPNKKDRDHQNEDRCGSNDVQWYAANDALLRDAASIPFSWSTGIPVYNHDPNINQGQGAIYIPGLQVLYLTPSIGHADSPTSPINVASTAVYSFIRHANSGHANYDSPDLMIYIMSMSQVYAYINFLQRVYGMVTLYSQRNRYVPDVLLKAQGVDPVDVRSHLADFRYGINVLVDKAASLAVPADFTIFKRTAFLYQNIYSEGTSMKDQLYMYSPDRFWQYQLAADGSGMLKAIQFHVSSTLYTVDQLLQFGNNLLNPVLQSEDMNIMSGDILKAYGQGGIIKLSRLEPTYAVLPVFNIGVLEQMKNATVMGNAYTIVDGDVIQEPNHGYLLHLPKIGNTATGSSSTFVGATTRSYEQDRVITTTTNEVNADLVMESTRLMVGAKYLQLAGDTQPYEYAYPASEMVTDARIFVMSTGGNYESVKISYIYTKGVRYALSSTDLALQDTGVLTGLASTLSNFRYHPCVNIWMCDVNAGVFGTLYQFGGQLFDYDNFAVLSTEDLVRIHEAALMNMLHVPSVGTLK